MSHTRSLSLLASFAAAAAISGCLSKATVEPVRYFSPGVTATPAAAPAAAKTGATPLWLRRVTAANHLQERMTRRTSDVELGFSDLHRWSDPPSSYVERALARELFETKGIERADAARVPRLDVEVRAFEERMLPAHVASVAIAISLLDAHDLALLEGTYTAESPVKSDDPQDFARAMGLALEDAVRAASNAIEGALRKAKT